MRINKVKCITVFSLSLRREKGKEEKIIHSPMMSFTGRLRWKVEGYLFQASGIKRVEISLVEVLKGKENLSFGSVKGPKRE